MPTPEMTVFGDADSLKCNDYFTTDSLPGMTLAPDPSIYLDR